MANPPDDYKRGRKDEESGKLPQFKDLSNVWYNDGRRDEKNYQHTMWDRSSKSSSDKKPTSNRSYSLGDGNRRPDNALGVVVGGLVLFGFVLMIYAIYIGVNSVGVNEPNPGPSIGFVAIFVWVLSIVIGLANSVSR